MKKSVYLFFVAALIVGFVACSSDILVTGVSLNTNTLTLNVSEVATLTATITPNDADNQRVTWSSDNTAIATVNANGVVTAVAGGTTRITVRTEDGGHTATATVIVSTPTTGVTLNKRTLELAVRETETLIATVEPSDATNPNVTWRSSDNAIATVNANGIVTAVAAGTTTITVTTADGAHTDYATVTVVTVSVTGVTLDRNEFTLFIGETQTLTATIIPANATNLNVVWYSGNSSVATVDDNGVVTAISSGTAYIIVFTEDGNWFTSSRVTVINPGIGAPTATADPGVIIGDIRWATRNVDTPGTFATNPENGGMFYQWNRRTGWSTNDPMINSDGGTTWVRYPARGEEYTEWQIANNPCPVGWRVPTQAEFASLRNAPHIWTTRNDVNGRLFGTTPYQVFLPAIGSRDDWTGSLGSFTSGRYWTATAWDETIGAHWGHIAFVFSFNNTTIQVEGAGMFRGHGLLVRCVTDD